jgi:hypothetical protein
MSQKDIRVIDTNPLRKKQLPPGLEKVRQRCSITANPSLNVSRSATVQQVGPQRSSQLPMPPATIPQPGQIWEEKKVAEGATASKLTIISATGIMPNDILVVCSAEELQKGSPTEVWAINLGSFTQNYKAS